MMEQTGEQIEEQVEYAGFWMRFLATLIDTILLTVFVSVPLTLIYGVQHYWTGEAVFLGFWDLFLGYVAPVILTIWFWMRFLGTPGKMLLGLQVVNAKTMSALTIWQSIGRYLGYIFSTIIIFMGFFWIAFDSRKQGWHDKLAGSVVIKKSAQKQPSKQIESSGIEKVAVD